TPVIPVPPVDPVDPAVPEILPDDPTPLAPAPDTAGGNTVIIIDEDTPLGNLPQTGMQDKRNLSAAGMAAMGLSALLTLAGFFFKKRQENG
ncbi:MAG: LPXTG cell wall anchor domain-containing protein, partial [Oscillospiraceae bacterium]